MERAVRIVAIVCPDKYGIHRNSEDGVYVRYAILTDAMGNNMWIDDPDFEQIREIVYNSAEMSSSVIESPCPWCQARDTAA